MEVHATLNGDARCVGDARRLIQKTLEAWGLATLCADAALLVSELTTNAILHAHSKVAVNMRTDPAGVRVEVCDHSPVPPQVRRFSAEAATGRGVRLLETLADAWGVQARSAGGKCVWFTLSLNRPAQFVEWEFDVAAVEPL